MLGKDISEALGGIAEDKIEAAARIAPRSYQHIWLRVAAVAAVVAMVIGLAALWDETEPGEQMGMPTVGTTVAPTELPTTLPDAPTVPTQTQGYELVKMSNVLKLYGSDNKDATEEELKQYEMTDGIDSYGEVIWYGGGFSKGISLMFKFPNDYYEEAQIAFEVSADYGYFLVDDTENPIRECVLAQNGDILWWIHGAMAGIEEEVDKNGRFYSNVIIYADERVVGYGIIDFCYGIDNFGVPIFWTTGFTTVCFPMVDGEYQEVSEEHVWEQIEEHKRMKAELEEV